MPPAISDEARARSRLMELKVNGSAPSERSAKVAPDFNGTTDATLTPRPEPRNEWHMSENNNNNSNLNA